MRCNWRRWLWGLIPLTFVSWVAVQVERGRIEQDLAERAGKTLAGSGAAWATVALKGRDAELAGRAVQDSQPHEAEQAVRNVWGIRAVDNKASLPPKIEPFLWSARRRGNRIRLSGYVPNRATRQTIIGMTNAALPGFDVLDRTAVARGAPPTDIWLAGLSFALKQLASLKQGNARLEDLALTITGEAEDANAYRAVTAALKTGLPRGIRLANVQITAPVASPYTWSAQFAGGQLVLSGHVAGEGARSELLAAAATAPPGNNVVDRMEPAEGAPQGWATVAAAAVKELVRLQSGNVEMKDAVLSVSGIAADDTQAQAVRAALRGALQPNFKLSDQIRVREAAKAPEPAPKAEPMPATPEPQAPAAPAPKPSEPPPQPQAEPTLQPPPKQAEPVPQPPPTQAPPKTALVSPAPAPPPSQAVVNICQENLSKIAGTGPILFDSDSATLNDASFQTLTRLAAAAKLCPGVRIAIEGHADIEGSAEYNQRLSVRRARAVAAYLVKAGADAEQLEAVGFGSSRPAAPNNTAESKARNRRIEFIVRQP